MLLARRFSSPDASRQRTSPSPPASQRSSPNMPSVEGWHGAGTPGWAQWYIQQLGGGAAAEQAVDSSLARQQQPQPQQRSSSTTLTQRQLRRRSFAEQGRAALEEASAYGEATRLQRDADRRRSAERAAFERQAAGLREMLPPRPAEPSNGLTAEQIGRLETLLWSDECATHDCAVCMAAFTAGEELIRLPCSPLHCMHTGCIASWLERQRTCPVCRAVVSTEVVVS